MGGGTGDRLHPASLAELRRLVQLHGEARVLTAVRAIARELDRVAAHDVGTEGQDRESYTDTQDRENYICTEEEEE